MEALTTIGRVLLRSSIFRFFAAAGWNQCEEKRLQNVGAAIQKMCQTRKCDDSALSGDQCHIIRPVHILFDHLKPGSLECINHRPSLRVDEW